MDIQKLHNKKIDIFGTKHTIKIVDRIYDDNAAYDGSTYHDSLIIKIAKYVNNAKISNEEMTRTLLHEINNAIFTSGQYLDSNADEQLVEWVARCYCSILFKQKIFKDYD